MQAIQVKYLGQTKTKPARMKVFSQAGSITEQKSITIEHNAQARLLAERFMISKTWDGNCIITGHGILPNGNDVFTIGNK